MLNHGDFDVREEVDTNLERSSGDTESYGREDNAT